MARPSNPLQSRRAIIILVLISITIITIDARASGPVRAVRRVALDVVSPVRSAADTVFSPLRSAWNGTFKYSNLKTENARLRAENDKLRGDAAKGAAADAQYQQLLKDTKLGFLNQYSTVASEVVADALSNYDETFQINKGSNEGVREGDPVVTGAGLVGRVIRVGSENSIVRLITDPKFGVGARVVPAMNGVIKGRGQGQPLALASIADDMKVAVGDLVESSGAKGSGLPGGIPIGKVSKVTSSAASGFQDILVTPLPTLGRLQFVSVILLQGKAP